MTRHFLTIEDDQLRDYTSSNAFTIIATEADLRAVFDGGEVFCSSTIDFPREATSDPTVLALVALLRRADA